MLPTLRAMMNITLSCVCSDLIVGKIFNDCDNNGTAVAFAGENSQTGSLVSGNNDRKSCDISLFYETGRKILLNQIMSIHHPCVVTVVVMK